MKNTLLSLGTLASLALVHSAFANDSYKDKDCKDGNDSCSDSSDHHWRHYNWAISLSPRYYGLNSSGYSSAFTGAGVSGPKSGTVGGDFTIYGTLDSGWQIGIGFGGVGTNNSNGATSAEYSDSFFGLWLAKDIQLNDDIDVAVGGLFGYGSARMEVISTGASGRTDESSFTLEPKIVVAYKIAPWIKIGVSGSYVEPLAQNQSIHGNTLTTGNISLHGASGGIEFVFGRFGQHS